MNIQRPFSSAFASFKNYCESTQKVAKSIVVSFCAFRNDPDFFQKVFQVAFAVLQLIIIRSPGVRDLSRLSFVLKTANMHDFYRFIQQPRQWFFPVKAETIKENRVLEDLIKYIQNRDNEVEVKIPELNPFDTREEGAAIQLSELDQLEIKERGEPEVQDKLNENDHSDVRKLVKKVLGQLLSTMASEDHAYRNFDEFKNALQVRLNKNLSEDLDLTDLQVTPQWIRRTPFIERIINLSWFIVDIGCIGLYFQEWRLLDTAKWAAHMGQYSAFRGVKDHHLAHWVVGLVSSTFAIKLVEMTRRLQDDALTVEERRHTRWNWVTALGELVFFGTTYMDMMGQIKVNHAYLHCFAIVAKSLGLLSIVTRPKHQFFQKPVRVA